MPHRPAEKSGQPRHLIAVGRRPPRPPPGSRRRAPATPARRRRSRAPSRSRASESAAFFWAPKPAHSRVATSRAAALGDRHGVVAAAAVDDDALVAEGDARQARGDVARLVLGDDDRAQSRQDVIPSPRPVRARGLQNTGQRARQSPAWSLPKSCTLFGSDHARNIISQFRKHPRHMPHLAAGAHRLLAVEVHAGAGRLQPSPIVGDLVADQVDHLGAAMAHAAPRAASRPPRGCAARIATPSSRRWSSGRNCAPAARSR